MKNSRLKFILDLNAQCSVLDRDDVRSNLIYLWGKLEFRTYVLNILLTERLSRQGLPSKDFSIMRQILAIHDEEYPGFVPGPPFNRNVI